MTKNERLIERLRGLGVNLPPGTRIDRTYAGRDQRAKGAWSWFAVAPAPAAGERWVHLDVGSHWPVSYLLRCRELVIDSPDDPERFFTRNMGTSIEPSVADLERLGLPR